MHSAPRRLRRRGRLKGGDPTIATAYDLCVYDREGGVDRLVLWHRIPAGAAWKETKKGFRYLDKTYASSGIGRVVLREGADGRARITVTGKGVRVGVTYADLPLAQDTRVSAQLNNGTACWQAFYDANRQNTAAAYKARAIP